MKLMLKKLGPGLAGLVFDISLYIIKVKHLQNDSMINKT